VADSVAEPSKGTKTETTTRQYDDAGKLVSETTTIVVRVQADDDKPWPGMYL
jgi:YD repeat-containing protein